MRSWLYWGAALLLALSLVLLGRAEKRVAHFAVELDGGVPAVVYEPGPQRFFGAPAERDAPLPVLVLAHGFSGNKGMMSFLGRGLARAGYAVVALDFRGHGANGNPFAFASSGDRGLGRDLDAALLYAATQPHYDGERIALAGHSMGGFAVLDYASRNPGLRAVVALSAGAVPQGPHTPANALLIWASRDPEGLRDGARDAAAHFAGKQQVVLGRTYGEPRRGTAVRAEQVDGTDHLTILYSRDTVKRVSAWLEATLGPGDPPVDQADGRLLWSALGLVAFLIVFAAIVARLAPALPEPIVPEPGKPFARVVHVLGALIAAVAVLSGVDALGTAGPFAFVPLVAGRDLIGFYATTGLALGIAVAGRGIVRSDGLGAPRTWLAAALLLGFAYLVFGSLAQPYSDAWLAAHRLPVAALCTLLAVPFFATTEWLLRGPGAAGIWAPALAKLVTLVVIAVAAATGLLPFVLLLGLGVFVLLFVVFEIVCGVIARTAPNPWLTTLLQSGWTGWTLAAVFPAT